MNIESITITKSLSLSELDGYVEVYVKRFVKTGLPFSRFLQDPNGEIAHLNRLEAKQVESDENAAAF